MRMTVAVGLLLLVGIPDRAAFPSTEQGCTFNLAGEKPVPEIVGAPDMTARARVMSQPDSPLAVVRVDLSGVRMTAGPGWFEESGRYAVDVKNVSAQVLTDARVSVRVRLDDGGVGSGGKSGRALEPGEQIRIEWTSGPGRGTSPSTGEVSVVALVDAVKTATCTYTPSQAWPNRATRP